MSQSIKKIAGSLFALGFMLLSISSVFPQTSWATLAEPPSGTAPQADVLNPGHLGRQIGNVELIIHFYHDLLEMGLLGPRGQPRPFGSRYTNPALLEFAQLGQGVSNPMDARNRAVILPIPGTAGANGREMAVEAIEIKGIDSKPYRPRMSDPGSSRLVLIVRDLDTVLAHLKDELVPVITVGGDPVVLPNRPGIEGRIRSVFVRDPDGYPVELMEINPLPDTSVPAESNILGARVSVVVQDLETTCRWFQHLVGPDFKFWVTPSPVKDKAYMDLTNTSSPFRMALAMIPGSPVIMEFIQYQNYDKNFVRPHFQDPGAAHILFMSRDVDIVMSRMREANLQTLSKTGGPVFIGPTTRSFFCSNSRWILG
jgi:catechol 2,3-dioxygenase-like lactoylglutathione lyase family enzyme